MLARVEDSFGDVLIPPDHHRETTAARLNHSDSHSTSSFFFNRLWRETTTQNWKKLSFWEILSWLSSETFIFFDEIFLGFIKDDGNETELWIDSSDHRASQNLTHERARDIGCWGLMPRVKCVRVKVKEPNSRNWQKVHQTMRELVSRRRRRRCVCYF